MSLKALPRQSPATPPIVQIVSPDWTKNAIYGVLPRLFERFGKINTLDIFSCENRRGGQGVWCG